MFILGSVSLILGGDFHLVGSFRLNFIIVCFPALEVLEEFLSYEFSRFLILINLSAGK